VQARAGSSEMARRIGQGIRAALPAVAQDFLRQQRMAIAASIDAGGHVWASLLTGGPGFMQALDDRTVWVDATPIGGDPLLENLAVCRDIGLLAIDLATRRRIRVNGTAELRSDGLYVYTQQVFSNCPKYIQARDFTPEDLAPGETPIVRRTALLTLGHQRALAQADTFFIATAHPEAGGDASHRGGNPGFVRVVDAGTLQFPDYPGNTMFQTLGNLEVNPRAGLLFIDFERGTTLQLTGKASVIWDAERRAVFTGAERVVEVHVEEAIEIEGGNKLRWRLLSYSPFNPA
jgi:predicted pyridoxine 5'-phosphate oxidase superfamily flavin-nucleotide-binding protein